MRNNGDLETTVRYRIKISRYIMRYFRDTSISISTTLLYGKTPESGIPPRYRATRRYKKVHLELSLRFSTLISYRFSALDTGGTSGRGCSGWPSPLSGGPYRFLAAKRQKKQIFPRAIPTTELPSNPSPLTFRDNQIYILQTSSTHAIMAANVSLQDMNTHGTSLSDARTHIQRETNDKRPDSPATNSRTGGEINVVLQQQRRVRVWFPLGQLGLESTVT